MFVANEKDLKRQVVELKEKAREFNQKSKLLMVEDMFMEEATMTPEGMVDTLTQANKVLIIQSECLDRDVDDRDKILGETIVGLGRVIDDL